MHKYIRQIYREKKRNYVSIFDCDQGIIENNSKQIIQ